MQILTEAYKDRVFFVPLNTEKTEGLYAKPLSATQRRKITQEALKEAGSDLVIASHLECVKFLQSALTDWKGMYDMGGEPIPFSEENIRLACENDPDIMRALTERLKNIARFGEIEDEKNS